MSDGISPNCPTPPAVLFAPTAGCEATCHSKVFVLPVLGTVKDGISAILTTTGLPVGRKVKSEGYVSPVSGSRISGVAPSPPRVRQGTVSAILR